MVEQVDGIINIDADLSKGQKQFDRFKETIDDVLGSLKKVEKTIKDIGKNPLSIISEADVKLITKTRQRTKAQQDRDLGVPARLRESERQLSSRRLRAEPENIVAGALKEREASTRKVADLGREISKTQRTELNLRKLTNKEQLLATDIGRKVLAGKGLENKELQESLKLHKEVTEQINAALAAQKLFDKSQIAANRVIKQRVNQNIRRPESLDQDGLIAITKKKGLDPEQRVATLDKINAFNEKERSAELKKTAAIELQASKEKAAAEKEREVQATALENRREQARVAINASKARIRKDDEAQVLAQAKRVSEAQVAISKAKATAEKEATQTAKDRLKAGKQLLESTGGLTRNLQAYSKLQTLQKKQDEDLVRLGKLKESSLGKQNFTLQKQLALVGQQQAQINRLNSQLAQGGGGGGGGGVGGRLEGLFADGGARLFKTQVLLRFNNALQNLALQGFQGSLRFIADYDEALKNVQAISLSSEKSITSLSEVFQKVGSTTKFSSLEVAQAAVTLAQAGFSVDQIKSSIGAIAELATASGTDFAAATDIATTVLTVFQLEASQMGTVANVMVKALNDSKLSLDQISLALQYAGNIAADSNISFTELVASFGTLADAGIRSGSTIGTGISQLINDLRVPSAKLTEEITRLGLGFADVSIETLGLTKVIENLREAGFTTASALEFLELRSARAFSGLANGTTKTKELALALIGTDDAAQAARIQMEAFNNIVKNLVATFQNLVQLSLSPYLEMTKELLISTTEFVNYLTQFSDQIGFVVAGITALLGLRIIAWTAQLLRGLLGISKAATVLRLGFTLMGSGFLALIATPVGAFFTAIAAAIGAATFALSDYNEALDDASQFEGKILNLQNERKEVLENQNTSNSKRDQFIAIQSDLIQRKSVLKDGSPELAQFIKTLNLTGSTEKDFRKLPNNASYEQTMARVTENIDKNSEKSLKLDIEIAKNSERQILTSQEVADNLNSNLIKGFNEVSRNTFGPIKTEGILGFFKSIVTQRGVKDQFANTFPNEERLSDSEALQSQVLQSLIQTLKGFTEEEAASRSFDALNLIRGGVPVPEALGFKDLSSVLENLRIQIDTGKAGAIGDKETQEAFIANLERLNVSQQNQQKQVDKALGLAKDAKVREDRARGGLTALDPTSPEAQTAKAVFDQLTNSLDTLTKAVASPELQKSLPNTRFDLGDGNIGEFPTKREDSSDESVKFQAEAISKAFKFALDNASQFLKEGEVKFSTSQVSGLDKTIELAAIALKNFNALTLEADDVSRNLELDSLNVQLSELKKNITRRDQGVSSAESNELAEILNRRSELLFETFKKEFEPNAFALQRDPRLSPQEATDKIASVEAQKGLDLQREALAEYDSILLDQAEKAKQFDAIVINPLEQAFIDFTKSVNNINQVFEDEVLAARQNVDNLDRVLQTFAAPQNRGKVSQDQIDIAQRAKDNAEVTNFAAIEITPRVNKARALQKAQDDLKTQRDASQESLAGLGERLSGATTNREKRDLSRQGNQIQQDLRQFDEKILASRDELRTLFREIAELNKQALAIGGEIVPQTAGEAVETFIQNKEAQVTELRTLGVSVSDALNEAFNSTQSAFGDTVFGFVTGTETIGASFRNMTTSVLSNLTEIASQRVSEGIFSSLFDSGGGAAGSSVAGEGFSFLRKAIGFASGGPVRGGRPNRDSVPAMLMPGEYVVNKKAVDTIGVEALERINRGAAAGNARSSNLGSPSSSSSGSNGLVNVYVVSPDAAPPIGPSDVIAIISDNIARGGSIRQLIKQVAI